MEKFEIKANELIRAIRDEQHNRLKRKSWEERVAFYEEEAARLHGEICEEETDQPEADRFSDKVKKSRL